MIRSTLPTLVALALGCSGPTSSTTTGSTSDDLWAGIGPMTLTIDGETLDTRVYASGGYEMGTIDQPPIVIVVPEDGVSTETTSGGLSFTNMSLVFAADPDRTGGDWLAGRDVSGDAATLGILLGGLVDGRLIGGDKQECPVDLTHRSTYPPNPIQPDTAAHRYSLEVDCRDVIWEDAAVDGAEGVYGRVAFGFDVLIGVSE